MKFKNLSLAIFSAFMLSACGGGSSSSDSNPGTGTGTGTGTIETVWTNFSPFVYKENSTAPAQLILDHSEFILVNGKGFTRTVSGFSYDDDLDQPLSHVTQDNLYKYGELNTNYGINLGNFQVKTPNSKQLIWIHQPIPVNSSSASDLEFTATHNIIDISNKKVLDYMEQLDLSRYPNFLDMALDISYINGKILKPYTTNYNEFFEKIKNKTFPTGSKCLQLQRLESNKDYDYLNTYPINSPAQLDLQKKWATSSKDQTFTFKNTQGMEGYFQTLFGIESGYALIQGRYYEITPYKQGIEFDRDEVLKALAELSNTTTSIGHDCKDLNEVAASVFLDALK